MKGEKAICPICGDPYIKKTRASRACSPECLKKLYRQEHRKVYKKICARCGREFETARSYAKYCSETCATEARQAKSAEHIRRKRVILEDRPCAHCGKMFTPRTRTHATCSTECRKAYLAKRLSESFAERVLAPKKCARCGKEFIPATNSAKYCCDECRKAAAALYWKKDVPTTAEPQKKNLARLNRPAKRWATMSWTDVSLENEYYGFSYPESQIRAYAGTLPEDYGLKRKKAK